MVPGTGDDGRRPVRPRPPDRPRHAFRPVIVPGPGPPRRYRPRHPRLPLPSPHCLTTPTPGDSHMSSEVFEVIPVAHIIGRRTEPTDDYWGGTRSVIRVDGTRFTSDPTKGLEEFSHLEVVFRFHLTDPTDLNLGPPPPPHNPDWPEVRPFGHRT